MLKWLWNMFGQVIFNFIDFNFGNKQIEYKPINKNNQEHNKHERSLIRNAVWVKYYGDQTNLGKCYCCNNIVQRYQAGWHCSHVISDALGGSYTVDNLRICCPHCNLSMGNQNLYAFIRDKKLIGLGSRNVKSYMNAHPDQSNSKRTNNWNK